MVSRVLFNTYKLKNLEQTDWSEEVPKAMKDVLNLTAKCPHWEDKRKTYDMLSGGDWLEVQGERHTDCTENGNEASKLFLLW